MEEYKNESEYLNETYDQDEIVFKGNNFILYKNRVFHGGRFYDFHEIKSIYFIAFPEHSITIKGILSSIVLFMVSVFIGTWAVLLFFAGVAFLIYRGITNRHYNVMLQFYDGSEGNWRWDGKPTEEERFTQIYKKVKGMMPEMVDVYLDIRGYPF